MNPYRNPYCNPYNPYRERGHKKPASLGCGRVRFGAFRDSTSSTVAIRMARRLPPRPSRQMERAEPHAEANVSKRGGRSGAGSHRAGEVHHMRQAYGCRVDT